MSGEGSEGGEGGGAGEGGGGGEGGEGGAGWAYTGACKTLLFMGRAQAEGGGRCGQWAVRAR